MSAAITAAHQDGCDGVSMNLRSFIEWIRNSTNWVPTALIAVAVVTTCIPDAYSAPQMTSVKECEYYADMALVARALVEENAADELVLGVLRRVYEPKNKSKGTEMAVLLVARARTSDLSAQEFNYVFNLICRLGGGNIDGFFAEGL